MILPSQYFFLLGHSRMMHRIHLLVSPFKMEMIVGPQLWKVMGRLRPMTANHKGPIGALLQAAKERKISQIRDHWMCLVTDARFFLSLYQPSRNKENGSSMLPIRNLAKERRQAVFTQCMLDLNQIDCTKTLRHGWGSVIYVRSLFWGPWGCH